MKFTNLKFKRADDNFGWLSQTKIGDSILSVFAGKMAYCKPKHDLFNLRDYNAFEVAIFDGSHSKLITREVFPNELEDVLAYRTPEEIDEIIKHLESL